MPNYRLVSSFRWSAKLLFPASLSHSSSKVSSSSVENDSTCVSFSSRWQSREVSAVSLSSLCFCGWPWKGFNVYICIVRDDDNPSHFHPRHPKNGGLSRFCLFCFFSFRWASRSFEHQRTRMTLTGFKIRLAAWTALNVHEWDYFVFKKAGCWIFVGGTNVLCVRRKKCVLMIRLCVVCSVYNQSFF